MEHHPRLARGQRAGDTGQHVDDVAGQDRRRVRRGEFQRRREQGTLAMVLRPHQRLQPGPFGGIGRVHRVQVDAEHAGDRGLAVQVGQRPRAVAFGDQLDR